MNIFTAWDQFIIKCEDYFDYRIKNGKFIDDLRFLSWLGLFKTSKKYKATIDTIHKSPTYNALLKSLQATWANMMRIEVFENIATVIADAMYISKRYFTEYFIVLLFGLSTIFFLLLQFVNNPVFLSIVFIPLLLFDHLCLSALYVTVDNEEHDIPASLLLEAKISHQNIKTSLKLFLLYFAVIVTSILFLLGFAFLLSYIFDRVGIEWGTSFIYWAIIIILGIFIIIGDFVYTVITYIAYLYALLDKNKLLEALENAYSFLSKFNIQVFFFAILLTICLISVTFYASITYYEAGFGLALLFTMHITLFLSYLLRRKFIGREPLLIQNTMHKFTSLQNPLLLFGLLSYIALTFLTIQNYNDIIRILQQQKESASLVNEFSVYQNEANKYVINYPKNWYLYPWNQDSITLYSNYTGTQIGGIWVNVDVYQASSSAFTELRNTKAGLFAYDAKTKNVTTKISNIIIQGSDGVKYTFIKNDGVTPEYQTHYLISKDKNIYDIDFVTSTSTMQNINAGLFERMMQSFRFIE